jgi:hypothetical protein
LEQFYSTQKTCFRFNAELAWLNWQQQQRLKFGLADLAAQKDRGPSAAESPLDLSSSVRGPADSFCSWQQQLMVPFKRPHFSKSKSFDSTSFLG